MQHAAQRHARSILANAKLDEATQAVHGNVRGIPVSVGVREDPDPQALGGKLVVVEATTKTSGLRVDGFFGDAKNRIFTGDAAFDRAYVLRAAPGDVAVALFDESSRAAILRIRVRVECDRAGIRLLKIGDEASTPDVVRAMIDLVVSLAERLPGVVALADERSLAHLKDAEGSSADEDRRQAALEALRARRLQEMASLEDIIVTGGRRSSSSIIVVIIVTTVVFFLVILGIIVLVVRRAG